jgi:glycosyltransferase involved in cell wall biosynthesis
MAQAARVSILLPCYELAGSIAGNIDRVVTALAGEPGVEVIVADDGSTDGTRLAAERAAVPHGRVSVIASPHNEGKGRVLQRAFSASTGATVVFLDGDLDLPPEQVPAFVARLEERGLDALLGGKRDAMVGGGYPAARRVLSRIFSAVVKLAFRLPVTETQTGLKAFRRDALEATLPLVQISRYTFDLELVVRLHRGGFRVEEAPVELDVQASSSRVTLGTLWEMGRDTAGLWFRSLRWRRPR